MNKNLSVILDALKIVVEGNWIEDLRSGIAGLEQDVAKAEMHAIKVSQDAWLEVSLAQAQAQKAQRRTDTYKNLLTDLRDKYVSLFCAYRSLKRSTTIPQVVLWGDNLRLNQQVEQLQRQLAERDGSAKQWFDEGFNAGVEMARQQAHLRYAFVLAGEIGKLKRNLDQTKVA